LIPIILEPSEGPRDIEIQYHTPDHQGMLSRNMMFRFTMPNQNGFDLQSRFVSSSLVSINFQPPIFAPWEESDNSGVNNIEFYVTNQLFQTTPVIFKWIDPRLKHQQFLQGNFVFLPSGNQPFTDDTYLHIFAAHNAEINRKEEKKIKQNTPNAQLKQ